MRANIDFMSFDIGPSPAAISCKINSRVIKQSDILQDPHVTLHS